MKDSHIEKEAAEALLDVGVSVPFKELRLPWRKEAIRLRFRMGRPRLGGQIRIARLFAGMNVTHAELEAMTESERLAWLGEHGRTVSRIVALTICRNMPWLRFPFINNSTSTAFMSFLQSCLKTLQDLLRGPLAI